MDYMEQKARPELGVNTALEKQSQELKINLRELRNRLRGAQSKETDETLRLYEVKARGYAQVFQVPARRSSLHSNGTFLLEAPALRRVFMWHGCTACARVKGRAVEAANSFTTNTPFKLITLSENDTGDDDSTIFFSLLEGVKGNGDGNKRPDNENGGSSSSTLPDFVQNHNNNNNGLVLKNTTLNSDNVFISAESNSCSKSDGNDNDMGNGDDKNSLTTMSSQNSTVLLPSSSNNYETSPFFDVPNLPTMLPLPGSESIGSAFLDPFLDPEKPALFRVLPEGNFQELLLCRKNESHEEEKKEEEQKEEEGRK
uniref:Gelsolin-like domain-containing protein n=1 Tax=Polytomella parva TaxID=51329 RepID=A0A7S0YE11_9CHLO|mmetsp:Transcript_12642/g.22557  ORF Transcript_12642/g.22557 Transcript_12642/m.22557 type:complete len:313 (+) Transcript_12642:47-985(+)